MNASPDSNDAPRRCADRSGVRHPPVEEWSQLTGQLTRSWRRAFSRRSNLLRRLLIAGWLAIAWQSAQADETTRIALEKTAWKQLSGPPLEWPQAGRPLVLAAGQELAMTGGGKTIQCGLCHGLDFKGLADVPGIAGRSPIYIARQLWDIKYGARAGISAALMLAVVANLSDEDVINLSAYVASLDP